MNGRRALVALLAVALLGARPGVALGAPGDGTAVRAGEASETTARMRPGRPGDLSVLQGGLQIDAPEVAVPGQPVEIGVTATPSVQDSQAGSITISLPGNPAVEVVRSTGPTTIWQPGQTMYHFGQGGQVPIGNRTVELFVSPWGAGTSHTLRIRVTPQGPLTFQARATFRSPSQGFAHLPAGGPPDQQGAPSRVVELGARQAPAPKPVVQPEPEPEPEPEPPAPTPAPQPPTPAPTAVPATPVPPTAAPTSAPATVAPTEAVPPPVAVAPTTPAQAAPTLVQPTTVPTVAAQTTVPASGQAAPTASVPATAAPRPGAASGPSGGEPSRLPLIIGGLALLGFGIGLGLVALILSMRRRRDGRSAQLGPRVERDAAPAFAPLPAMDVAPSPLPAVGVATGDDPVAWGTSSASSEADEEWPPALIAESTSDESYAGRVSPGAPIPWLGSGPARAASYQPSETPTFVGLRAPVERYQERSLVGRGGMGSVYRAFDTRLRRWVALKILHSDLSSQQEFVDRFLREAQLAAMLQHPNIVTIFDVEQLDEAVVRLVMTWVDGEDLQRVLEREGPLPPERAAAILDQLASALDHAHNQPIPVVHRDVKPSNVMLGRDDRVVLTDFGVARLAGDVTLTQSGQLVGTPAYMAPELVQGADADRRTDLYALGILLYQMLTGRPPFRAESPLAVLHAQLNVPPPPPSTFVPSLSPAVDRVLMTALEKDPNHRYQTASQLARELRAALNQPIVSAPAPEPASLVVGFDDERPASAPESDDIAQEAGASVREASKPG